MQMINSFQAEKKPMTISLQQERFAMDNF